VPCRARCPALCLSGSGPPRWLPSAARAASAGRSFASPKSTQEPKPILSLNKAWKAACRAAGCPGRIPHDLRRTAVRNFVRNGISESVAMQMTGHKTRSVFDGYNITSRGDLRDAAQLLDRAATQQTGARR
jgi:integrase